MAQQDRSAELVAVVAGAAAGVWLARRIAQQVSNTLNVRLVMGFEVERTDGAQHTEVPPAFLED